VHLWDETVGHLVWYAGVAVVVAALAAGMARERSPSGFLAPVLALAVGVTWATNAAGGDGTTWPGLRRRARLRGVRLAASGDACPHAHRRVRPRRRCCWSSSLSSADGTILAVTSRPAVRLTAAQARRVALVAQGFGDRRPAGTPTCARCAGSSAGSGCSRSTR
jgi:hypothetical protein